MGTNDDVARQIEAAYDFRGHVTLVLEDGRALEGFLFNRELRPLKGEPYVELMVKDSDQRLHLSAASVRSVTLTGKDFAAPFVPPPKT